MKLYLAGGFSVMYNKKRERDLYHKFHYKRLVSFFFMKEDLEIMEIAKREKRASQEEG